MRNILYAIVMVMFAMNEAPLLHAEELMTKVEKIIPGRSGMIPQAPRVSPDNQQLVFEYYSKDRVKLWHASVMGEKARCLTCSGKLDSLNLENAYWHPSGNYLVFNEISKGNEKIGDIYTASIKSGQLGDYVKVARGARPQFSHPNGHVIFFETAEISEGRLNNVLAYQILGSSPLKVAENMRLELRGPIQKVNQNSELSHPALAPDGTTIVFAARAGNFEGGSLVLNDTDRQKIFKLWKALIPVDKTKINAELLLFKKYYSNGTAQDVPMPAIGTQMYVTAEDFNNILNNGNDFLSQQTIVPGFTRKHLFFAWVLSLLDKLDDRYDNDVQMMVYPRLWMTDVFGAPVVPLVKDITATPLPQKWPTVSHDGKFVVFVAGHYTNRHIYLIARKNGQWQEKAIKITELGTYNSSPEIDPSGEWLYFESNRDGSKGIWRAKLNWPEINKRLDL